MEQAATRRRSWTGFVEQIRGRPAGSALPRLRGRLALFTVACAGVAAALIAALLLFEAAGHQATMRREIQDAASANAQFLDREIAVNEALLTGLASSPALEGKDWAVFTGRRASSSARRGSGSFYTRSRPLTGAGSS